MATGLCDRFGLGGGTLFWGKGGGHPYHGLEAGVQMGEEGWLPGQGQHPLLHHGALHVVVLDHHVLLQDLDGVQLLCALALG